MNPKEAVIFVGLVFSALLALVNAGTAYNELYNPSDPHDKRSKKEAIRSGLFTFGLFALITMVCAYLLSGP